MIIVASEMSVKNWSVTNPIMGSSVLASMFPSRPSILALSTMLLLVFLECVDATTPYGQKLVVKFNRNNDVIKGLLIGLACVSPVVLAGLLLYLYLRRRKRLTETAAALLREQEMIQQTLTRRAFVESFPVLVYFPPGEGEADTCSICLDEFAEGSNLRLLPLCTHLYHISCIAHWQVGLPMECPLCRRDYSSWRPEGGPPAE